ncbi:MAG: hypothetical protein ABI480_10895, partial [Chitinophagaceae bacterium]
MRRLPTSLLAFLMLLSSIIAQATDLYVSPNGSDTNPGTKDKPLATIMMALRKARELRRLHDASISNGIHIILTNGTYQLYEPIFIRPEDTGTATSPTWIEAAPNEKPVISGGMTITNWYQPKQKIAGLPSTAQGKVWVADLSAPNGQLPAFRQLWINNKKAIRARDRNADSMNRILSWNHVTEECWIPTPATPDLRNASGIEMFIHQWWAVATLRIKKMEVHGDSAKLSFYQPESKIQSEHPWPAPWESKETGNSAFYLTNAIQLLDEPGEWFLDANTHKLYYWPHNGEDLRTATVTAPLLETLVCTEGLIDHPVSYISFNGISFQHTGWLRPSQQGHVALQAGMYLLDAYKLKTPGTPDKAGLENQAWIGRQPAAVEASFANHISFTNCRFEHLAATGLDLKKATNHDEII